MMNDLFCLFGFHPMDLSVFTILFRISNFFDLSITEETWVVEMRIKIGNALVLHCFIQFVRLISVMALTVGNPVHLISTKGARWVWLFSRGCLLLCGTWSYLCNRWRSVLPYTRFCNCLLDYDYVLYIVNFAILY
jgi:hypothetical protein